MVEEAHELCAGSHAWGYMWEEESWFDEDLEAAVVCCVLAIGQYRGDVPEEGEGAIFRGKYSCRFEVED